MELCYVFIKKYPTNINIKYFESSVKTDIKLEYAIFNFNNYIFIGIVKIYKNLISKETQFNWYLNNEKLNIFF